MIGFLKLHSYQRTSSKNKGKVHEQLYTGNLSTLSRGTVSGPQQKKRCVSLQYLITTLLCWITSALKVCVQFYRIYSSLVLPVENTFKKRKKKYAIAQNWVSLDFCIITAICKKNLSKTEYSMQYTLILKFWYMQLWLYNNYLSLDHYFSQSRNV